MADLDLGVTDLGEVADDRYDVGGRLAGLEHRRDSRLDDDIRSVPAYQLVFGDCGATVPQRVDQCSDPALVVVDDEGLRDVLREKVLRAPADRGVDTNRALDAGRSLQHALNLDNPESRWSALDQLTMFERAADGALARIAAVQPAQRCAPTPCSEWDVDALLEHMAGGPAYLLAALDLPAPTATDVETYRAAVAACSAALRAPGALERRCQSPAGFEWSVAEAAAGTAMDQLVHTWDLAVATGGNRTLDTEVVDAVVAMFVPQMPEVGRAAGLVGPAVTIADDASAQDRLLGAMGRQP